MNADILDRQVLDRSSEPWHVARADRPHLVLVPTGPSVRPSREPRMRLTRRGRLVVLVLVAAILVVLLNAVAGSLASASGEVEQITVRAGQTLSGIAVDYLPELSVRDAVVELQLFNDLSTDQIHVGQTLRIPSP